jgi:hypothetical protein
MLLHAGTNVLGSFLPTTDLIIGGLDSFMILRGVVYWGMAVTILFTTRGRLGVGTINRPILVVQADSCPKSNSGAIRATVLSRLASCLASGSSAASVRAKRSMARMTTCVLVSPCSCEIAFIWEWVSRGSRALNWLDVGMEEIWDINTST